MQLETFSKFKDFELLDSGNEYRLERWGDVILARPDPQAIWQRHLDQSMWDDVHAIFDDHKRKWIFKKDVPKSWVINYPLSLPLIKGEDKTATEGSMKLIAKLTPFKHTGIFAEQATNWEWMAKKLEPSTSKLKALNLF